MYAYVVALACGGFPSPAQTITPLDMGYLAVISCVLLPVAFILLATGPRYISAAEVSLYMEVGGSVYECSMYMQSVNACHSLYILLIFCMLVYVLHIYMLFYIVDIIYITSELP